MGFLNSPTVPCFPLGRGVSIRELQAWRPKPQAQGVGPRRTPEPSLLLSRKLPKKVGKLVTKFPAEGFGKELGRECGLQPGKDLGTEPDSLLGKEPDKEL